MTFLDIVQRAFCYFLKNISYINFYFLNAFFKNKIVSYFMPYFYKRLSFIFLYFLSNLTKDILLWIRLLEVCDVEKVFHHKIRLHFSSSPLLLSQRDKGQVTHPKIIIFNEMRGNCPKDSGAALRVRHTSLLLSE